MGEASFSSYSIPRCFKSPLSHFAGVLVSVQTTLPVLRTQAMVLASEVHPVSSLCPMVLIESRHAP
jgi:hypothetical protein